MRCFTPLRDEIHSSVVSMIWDRSSLVMTRSGTAMPVPEMIDANKSILA